MQTDISLALQGSLRVGRLKDEGKSLLLIWSHLLKEIVLVKL